MRKTWIHLAMDGAGGGRDAPRSSFFAQLAKRDDGVPGCQTKISVCNRVHPEAGGSISLLLLRSGVKRMMYRLYMTHISMGRCLGELEKIYFSTM